MGDNGDLNESLALSENMSRLTNRMLGAVRGELRRHGDDKDFGSSYWWCLLRVLPGCVHIVTSVIQSFASLTPGANIHVHACMHTGMHTHVCTYTHNTHTKTCMPLAGLLSPMLPPRWHVGGSLGVRGSQTDSPVFVVSCDGSCVDHKEDGECGNMLFELTKLLVQWGNISISNENVVCDDKTLQ